MLAAVEIQTQRKLFIAVKDKHEATDRDQANLVIHESRRSCVALLLCIIDIPHGILLSRRVVRFELDLWHRRSDWAYRQIMSHSSPAPPPASADSRASPVIGSGYW